MSCGLPLEFFEETPACVQRLEPAHAARGVVTYEGTPVDAAAWLETIEAGELHVEASRPITGHSAYTYWITFAPARGQDAEPAHYLINWRTWFQLRRLGLL